MARKKMPPCDKCRGGCCHNVPMKMAQYELMQGIAPRDDVEMVDMGMADSIFIPGRCPWLSEEGRCEVYEYRPWVCRLIGTKDHPCAKMPGGKELADKILGRITDWK
jgi:Fe-S-cluster containining protein